MTSDLARTTHEFCVPADHPAFAGHFPGEPILPGAALLDAVLHRIAGDLGWHRGGWEIAAAKFLGRVRPGTVLMLAYERRQDGAIAFTVHEPAPGEAARSVASGVLRPPPARGGEA